MSKNYDQNERPDYDQVIKEIADYAINYKVDSDEAILTAKNCLIDSLGCALLALQFKACRKHLGPMVEGTIVPYGVRVPGTNFSLDPLKAAWDIGCLIRWLDYNDTWLAAEWGHPSDNLGSILSLGDHISQKHISTNIDPIKMSTILELMVKAHEIQGVLALENSAISHAWVDGSSLRTYRHAPNAGSRKSWAAGDASSRGVRLADIAMRGEMGIPGALTAKQWGFYDVSYNKTNKDQKIKPKVEKRFNFDRNFGTYVMENILFKINFPAEFHAQTSVEAAVLLHDEVKGKIENIEKIIIRTQESAIRIISKIGKLNNAADRDHCIQYMTAVGLIFGELKADHYEDEFHKNNPIIDILREKMIVEEDKRFTKEYLESDKRSIANAIQVFFNDGSKTDEVVVEYPIGHKKRRDEGIPLLEKKFLNNLNTVFDKNRSQKIFEICTNQEKLASLNVNDFMAMFVKG